MKGLAESFLILIAEDDPNDAALLQRALKKVGLKNPIYIVPDGEQTIAYLSGTGEFADRSVHPFPGMVFLDIKMPKKNGFEVLSWLREHPKCSIIPVIVWSSSNLENDLRVAYRLGANCYLQKPNDLNAWMELVRRTVEFWKLCERPDVPSC